uniref:Carbonic anhydrase n=1 Tax=Oryctolagus cuniculus TaxID=9986 RepID=G1T1V5_RABIT
MSSPVTGKATSKEWGYADHNGPDHWHELFPNAKGDNQSPIELHTKDVRHDPSLLPWSASYDPGSAKTILNNGKTCRVVFDDTYDRSMLRGGPLPGPYRLRQFHLHWGSSDDHGSEHIVDGVKYAAELHLVHWNPKYNTYGEALKQPDGIAVVGVFLKIGREKGDFQIFLDALDKIKTKGKEAPFSHFDPSCLFPACRDYWTYRGSFTTPPCEECIVWLLLKEPITVSSDQIAKLRSLFSSAENEPPVPMERKPITFPNKNTISSKKKHGRIKIRKKAIGHHFLVILISQIFSFPIFILKIINLEAMMSNSIYGSRYV